MKNKLGDLRDHLFETLEGLKDGSLDVDQAKAVTGVAQALIGSAKVELDYMRLTGNHKSSGLMPDLSTQLTGPGKDKK